MLIINRAIICTMLLILSIIKLLTNAFMINDLFYPLKKQLILLNFQSAQGLYMPGFTNSLKLILIIDWH